MLQGNVPSIRLLLLALLFWKAVRGCECAEEGWFSFAVNTAGWGLLLIPVMYDTMFNVLGYWFSQAERCITKANVHLASLLGMRDPEVSLACYALHMCILLQRPMCDNACHPQYLPSSTS